MITELRILLKMFAGKLVRVAKSIVGDSTTPMNGTLMKSLTDIKSRIASYYVYLHSRLDGNEEYGIPNIMPAIKENSSNILECLHKLDTRKIECGNKIISGQSDDPEGENYNLDAGKPEIPDGISLVNFLLYGRNNVTELIDTNYNWELSGYNILNSVFTVLPNVKRLVLNCVNVTEQVFTNYNEELLLELPYLEEVPDGYAFQNLTNTTIHVPIKTINQPSNAACTFRAKKVYFDELISGIYRTGGSAGYKNLITEYIYIACKGNKSDYIRLWHYYYQTQQLGNETLSDLEIRDGTCENIILDHIIALTEENIYNHILCKLKQDETNCGAGVNIILEEVNMNKLTSADSVAKLAELRDTYGYTFA